MTVTAAHADSYGPASNGSVEKAPEHQSQHAKNAVVIPEGGALLPPRVEIEVLKDPMSGWNLHVMTSEFRFAPEHVSGPVHLGEGHAHLYINDEKINRLYGPWYHLGKLSPGRHKIRVDITANNHASYTYQGEPIQDAIVISIEE